MLKLSIETTKGKQNENQRTNANGHASKFTVHLDALNRDQ